MITASNAHEFENESCVRCGVHEVHATVRCKPKCGAFMKWGESYSKYRCGKVSTRFHEMFGHLCEFHVSELRQQGAKGIFKKL